MDRDGFARQDLLAERLADWIREEVVLGRLKPGERLVEQALSTRLQVSRVPLREAFRIVAAEGLLTILPHRGATVAPMSETELKDLFGLRMALEGFAARAVAERAGTQDLDVVRTFKDQMPGAVRDGDFEAYHSLAAKFHSALVAASGNTLLIDAYNRVKIRFRRYQAAMAHIPDLPAQSMREHDGILDAIERRQPDEARRLAEEHIRGLIDRFGTRPVAGGSARPSSR